MKLQILQRVTCTVLFEHEEESNTIAKTVEAAARKGADLRGANLYGADLYGADLYGADLDGEILKKTPLTIANLMWFVIVSDGYLRIGCQRHAHAQWAEFSNEEVSKMSDHALEFWQQWKAPLLAMCAAHAAA